MNFFLCLKCINRLNSLRFKRNANMSHHIFPIGMISWEDELPIRRGYFNFTKKKDQKLRPSKCIHSKRCWDSFIKLTGARSQLLFNLKMSPEYHVLWDQALCLIPNWPGFLRVKLSPEDFEAVKQYQSEAEDTFQRLFNMAERVIVEGNHVTFEVPTLKK